MLRVNSIINVNNTPKSNISFGNGNSSNYLIPSSKIQDSSVEQGLITGFVGILRNSPLFDKVNSRAESIEKALSETNAAGLKLNIAA